MDDMTELITRLRAMPGTFCGSDRAETVLAAADALEAAQAELDSPWRFACPKDPPWEDGCGGGCYICYGHGHITPEHVQRLARDAEDRLERIDELEAERDAEAALADQLANAWWESSDQSLATWKHPALAAHRERRTTPTKPADDKTRWYSAPTKDGDQ